MTRWWAGRRSREGRTEVLNRPQEDVSYEKVLAVLVGDGTVHVCDTMGRGYLIAKHVAKTENVADASRIISRWLPLLDDRFDCEATIAGLGPDV